MAEERNFFKLPVLNKESEYLNWKRRIYAYLRRGDPELLALAVKPAEDSENYKQWVEKSTKAKSDIVLALGPSVTSKTSSIIDDDSRTAKELWDELGRLHTKTSMQAILNLKQELDSLMFDEKKDFNHHVNKFVSICDELASYGEDIETKDKSSKLIRSLPASFSALAMATSLTDTSFERITEAVKAELARRANPNNPHFRTAGQSAAQAYAVQTYQTIRGPGSNRQRGRFRGRGYTRARGRGYRDGRANLSAGEADRSSMPCYYCGKSGHFIRFCRLKMAHESSGRIQKSVGRGWRGRRGGHYGYGFNQRGSDIHPRSQDSMWTNDNSWPTHGQGSSQNSNNDFAPAAATNARFEGATAQHRPDKPRFDNPEDVFRSNAVIIQFKSTLARVNEPKSHRILIDSGATHNFFFDKSLFVEYTPIANETVVAAFGTTNILGKGFVWVPILGGMQIEAYHAPQFHSHILSVRDLSKKVDILFSENLERKSGCFFLRKGTREVLFETCCTDGLYAIDLFSRSRRKEPFANSAAVQSIDALEWHCKTGHPSPERYSQLSNILDNVPHFHNSILEQLDCVPCIAGKLKRAPVRKVIMRVEHPIEQIHLDISGPFVPTWNGETYAVHLVDAFTAKSDIHLLKSKAGLGEALIDYKAHAENYFASEGHRVKSIRLDKAGENFSNVVVSFCRQEGINLEPSPPYLPQSNGIAERLVQEHWTRARVLMFGCSLPKSMWGEALAFANWLRNRLPSSRISGELPIMRWNPNCEVNFAKIPTFGQQGFAFIYRSSSTPGRKMLPRSEPAQFVGMESNSRLIRVYVPASKSVRVVRIADFRVVKNNRLPGISALIDGLSRQTSIEVEDDMDNQTSNAEVHLVHCLAALHRETPSLAMPHVRTQVHCVPKSFFEACQSPKWAAAIDREYNALIARRTWTYVKRTSDMHVIDFLWTFRKKLLDALGTRYMCKARCCGRGDHQEENIDFDPDTLYAPVAAHESIRLIIAFAASANLILEGGDVANAYLYGKLDVPVYMEQPTDSSRRLAQPGMVCLLQRSIYGLKQAGHVWGSVLHSKLIEWGFTTSNFDPRVYLYRKNDTFIIIAIVVDDMAFASNSRQMLERMKQSLNASFDVSLFGELKSFIGWDITRSPRGIKIDQSTYARSLLQNYGLQGANAVRTPLPVNADLRPAREDEPVLEAHEHFVYRAIIGGLLYLAVCTRPDLSKPVGALSRQLHAPTSRHLRYSKRVLRYLVGTVNTGIHYEAHGRLLPSSLCAAVDADWGGDTETRRSTTGYVVAVNGSPIYWKSKRQTVIALSSAEAEYVALSTCSRDTSWLRKLYWEICHQTPWSEQTYFSTTRILVDSTAAAAIASSAHASSRTKHISLKYHHVRELIANGVVSLQYVPSNSQPADLLTKIMDHGTLSRMKELLKIRL